MLDLDVIMRDFDVLGPFIIATWTSLGALCLMVWAVFSGALGNSDRTPIEFLRREIGYDGSRQHDESSQS